MIEPIVALLLCTAVSLGLRMYWRFWGTESPRHPAFERWARERPVVAAFRCDSPTDAVTLYETVRRWVEPHDRFENQAGRFPWQHYFVSFDAQRVRGGIVLVRVVGARVRRAQARAPDVASLLDAVIGTHGDRIVDGWLWGALHPVPRQWRGELDRLGWKWQSGSQDVPWEPMIGQPPWLAEVLRRAA